MTWDADFYNITWVKLKESSIWKPDVTVSTRFVFQKNMDFIIFLKH